MGDRPLDSVVFLGKNGFKFIREISGQLPAIDNLRQNIRSNVHIFNNYSCSTHRVII